VPLHSVWGASACVCMCVCVCGLKRRVCVCACVCVSPFASWCLRHHALTGTGAICDRLCQGPPPPKERIVKRVLPPSMGPPSTHPRSRRHSYTRPCRDSIAIHTHLTFSESRHPRPACPAATLCTRLTLAPHLLRVHRHSRTHPDLAVRVTPPF